MQNFNFTTKRDGEDILLIPKASHTETLIWLHGLGDSAEGFFPVFSSEMNPCNATTKIVLLTAPTRAVTINMGMKFHSWYDIRDLRFDEADFEKTINLDEAKDSVERVNKVIEREANLLNGDYKRIVIGGFSQGCSISLCCGLQCAKTLGGIIGFSGFLFPITVPNKENENTPILLSHGRLDPLIPCVLAEKSYTRLDKKKHNLKMMIDENLDHGLGTYSLKWFKDFWTEIFKK